MKKNKLDNDSLNDIIHLSKNILKLLYVVLIIGIVLCSVVICQQLGIFSFLGNLFQVLAPFFIGFIIAWLFSPLVLKLTKKGFSRIMASIIIYVVFLLFLIIFVRIFIPVLYDEVNELLSQLPTILNRLTDFVNNFFSSIKIDGFDIDNLKNNVVLSLNEYGYSIADSLPNFIMQTVSSLASGIGTIFFGLVIGLYMLFDFDNVSNILIKLFPRKYQMEGLNLLTDIGCEVRKTVNGTLLVASMVFVCDTIGFAVIGLNAALLFGLFCGITDLIPYIGPWLGTFIATIVGFTQSPLIGIGVFVIAFLVQMVESYVLQPIVMSRATNLHPVTIIVGLLIFGHFFGIIGMILATPILSIIKVILRFLDQKYHLFNS